VGSHKIIGGLGGFAGLVELPSLRDPVLVAAADGVGTKVLIAEALNRYHTLGIDLVAMSVNDLLVTGARPLFILDYIAVGKLDPKKAALLVEGVAEGCRQSGCVLLGGETAEMPDLYQGGNFDLAGFAVGVVEKDQIIDGSRLRVGDVIIGLPSSGVHSNGFSLVRKILEVNNISYEDELPGVGPVGDVLLEPTKIYANIVSKLLEICEVRAMAHITGGGLPENVPRVLPEGLCARIDLARWQVPPVFDTLGRLGNVAPDEMLRTFNMGIGYVVIVAASDEKKALKTVPSAVKIGEITSGENKVLFVNA
jgi:phosphoribosylformylglycinamidine cyclo-ligase